MRLRKTDRIKQSAIPNRRTRILVLGVWVVCSVFLSGCNHDEVFYQFRSFENCEWQKDSFAGFEVNITDTLQAYDVFIEIRNNDHYAYKNIWLFASFRFPTGETRQDTIKFDLANEYGKWYGKGFSLYELSIPYETNIRYPRSGTYTYTIAQGMRDDLLKGICNVGVRVTYHK